jgi:uncharacterized protein
MRNAETVAAMSCPICKTGLTLSERAGIEIDYCPTCRGVWLDRGEIDKIIERSVADMKPAQLREEPARQDHGSDRYRGDDSRYRDDHRRYRDDDDDYRHGKRKKSFLSELFD